VRRLPPEALLAPVFALPVVVAVALLAWARADYFESLRRHAVGGEAAARRRLEEFPNRVEGIGLEDLLPPPSATEDGWVPFQTPRRSGFVRARGARAPQAPWFVAEDYPAGLRPSAIADANVRLAIESGTPTARVDAVDVATRAFHEILATRDAALLRSAPLPATTKLYLLRRIADRQPCEEDVTTLTLVDQLVNALPARPFPGAYEVGDGVALLTGRTTLVYGDRWELRRPELGLNALDPDGLVVLRWTAVPESGEGRLWSGWIDDVPLAGPWSFVAPHGDRWWEASPFTRWVAPAAVGCLAFLFIPTALLVAIRRRRRLDDARARFVNELAHDLRTPVTSLRLHAEMLAEGRVPDADRPRYLDVLGRETARLSALLANLLDLSRVERGARPFELRPTPVAPLLDEAVRDFAAIHPKRAADVTVADCDGLAAIADRTALARCVANLLDNAGKFTAAGTPIRVAADRADGGIRIVVADEGDGVAPAERSRIFQLYERGSAAKNGAPGTGVGLALVRELVEGMRGRVDLVDAPRGARFEIHLPEASLG
jgi:signal transduction histidine kinase